MQKFAKYFIFYFLLGFSGIRAARPKGRKGRLGLAQQSIITIESSNEES
jgi:hypothetical protein